MDEIFEGIGNLNNAFNEAADWARGVIREQTGNVRGTRPANLMHKTPMQGIGGAAVGTAAHSAVKHYLPKPDVEAAKKEFVRQQTLDRHQKAGGQIMHAPSIAM